jgi:hypothetical protein
MTMARYVTLIAIGKWDNRATLTYVPVNEIINGKRYNAFGVAFNAAGDPRMIRRPYRMEENGAETYVMYDTDEHTDVPIYKTVEV